MNDILSGIINFLIAAGVTVFLQYVVLRLKPDLLAKLFIKIMEKVKITPELQNKISNAIGVKIIENGLELINVVKDQKEISNLVSAIKKEVEQLIDLIEREVKK